MHYTKFSKEINWKISYYAELMSSSDLTQTISVDVNVDRKHNTSPMHYTGHLPLELICSYLFLVNNE